MSAYNDLKKRDQIGSFSTGKDSKGKFKAIYLKHIVKLSKKELREEIIKINTRFFKTGRKTDTDYFWKTNALYHECLRRECQKMYQEEYSKLYNQYIGKDDIPF